MIDEPADEVPTERDRVPSRLIIVAIGASATAIAASVLVVWLLAGRLLHGGGRTNDVELSLEPPADPFEELTEHERARLGRLLELDAWTWADPTHTHVRVPLDVAIDRYTTGGGR
jgi:hypothetical protein